MTTSSDNVTIAGSGRDPVAARLDQPEGAVVVTESGRGRLAQDIRAGRHTWTADEPAGVGDDTGPTPYDLLLGALGACTSMTLRMFADRKGWPLDHITVALSHTRHHADDAGDCETKPCMIDEFERVIELDGPLDDGQRAQLLAIAERCPVHRTLLNRKRMVTTLAERASTVSSAERS